MLPVKNHRIVREYQACAFLEDQASAESLELATHDEAPFGLQPAAPTRCVPDDGGTPPASRLAVIGARQ